MIQKDTFKTIKKPSEEVLFKDRNSKFFGYAFPVNTEDEVKEILNTIKNKHHKARHWCYAYQLGAEIITYRVNDDGEPSNTAGMPIYGQIQSFELTNVLVVVIRYFGGVKLGVSGLINAYRTCAQMALEVSLVKEKTIDLPYLISFGYVTMNTVMRTIKEQNLKIIDQKLELSCEIIVSVRKSEVEKVLEIFEKLYKVEIKKL